VVSYEVFELPSGERVLVRELSETEISPPKPPPMPPSSVEAVCALADSDEIGPAFRLILSAAQKHGLSPQPTKWAIRYAPPSDRRFTLFATWVPADHGKKGLIQGWIGSNVFPKFYPITEEQAIARLGPAGYR